MSKSDTRNKDNEIENEIKEKEIKEIKEKEIKEKEREDLLLLLLPPHEVDDALLEPFAYVNSVPGKDVRGKLIDCFQLWFEIESDDVLNRIKDIVTDLHNASLLIDDIEDNSKLRRGIPVANSIFGTPFTINCANYVYFLALEKCHALNNPRAMNVFVGELLNLHRGQGRDIYWRDALNCPTEEEYLQMVCDKTGGLFRLSVGLMQSFAKRNGNTNFSTLIDNLAMYFQIRDDYINLVDETYFQNKSYCEDLTEGKFSYPVIHCLSHQKKQQQRQEKEEEEREQQTQQQNQNQQKRRQGRKQDTRLLSILKQRTENVEVKRYAQRIMKECDSFKYTRLKCLELKREIVSEIETKLGGNPPLLELIEKLDLQLDGYSNDNNNSSTSATNSNNDQPNKTKKKNWVSGS